MLAKLAALTAAGVVATACGETGDASGCAEVERVPITSSLHVLPGAEVTFDISPPAGGPHQLPAPLPGRHHEPVPEAVQVAALEAGMVMIQYGDGVGSAAVDDLAALAGQAGVIVAPGVRPFDDGASVALTSWGRRQLCADADVGAAQRFVDRYAGVVIADHDT